MTEIYNQERSHSMDLETREFEVRLDETDERVIRGIAVPYNDVTNVGGYREKFVRGAIDDISDTKLFYAHNEPIGKIVRGEDAEHGYLIEARISKTPRGDEVLTLLKDGVLNRLSVGFQPVLDERDADGVVVRTKVNLREVSVVSFPAYPNASVLSVREEENEVNNIGERNMEPTKIESEVADLRTAIEDIDRRMVMASEVHPATSGPQFRSFGEFVHAVASGNEAAVELTKRVYTGQVLADSIVKDAWVSDVIRLVDLGRPTVNAFRRSSLPAEGMNVEWPQVKTNTLAVAAQALEGDLLTYGGIELESKTSPVKTYGGYTSLTRQMVERSSVNYLDTAFRAMAIAYSKHMNAQAIVALKALSGMGTATAAATAKGWIEAIADSAISIYTNTGLQPEFILAAPNVYKKAVSLFDASDRPIVGGLGLQNGIGTANVPGLTANVGGLPMIVDPALTAGDCFIANREAFITYESGGAPFRLSAQDITALTSDFSVYGYAAFAGPNPAAIVDVTVA